MSMKDSNLSNISKGKYRAPCFRRLSVRWRCEKKDGHSTHHGQEQGHAENHREEYDRQRQEDNHRSKPNVEQYCRNSRDNCDEGVVIHGRILGMGQFQGVPRFVRFLVHDLKGGGWKGTRIAAPLSRAIIASPPRKQGEGRSMATGKWGIEECKGGIPNPPVHHIAEANEHSEHGHAEGAVDHNVGQICRST